MNSDLFTLLFVAALVASVLMRTWLAMRQIRHVVAHRGQVPPPFAATISLAAHQKAADYARAKTRFGLLTMAFGALVLVGWTLLGGLDGLNVLLREALVPRFGGMTYQVTLVVTFALIGGALELPFDAWNTFRLEEHFGFNRTTPWMFVTDLVKSLLVSAVIGLPLITLILWIMAATGALWWLWAWGAWVVFNLAALVLYPSVIAPLFNKFEPLADETLKHRVSALMTRCGFAAKELFVMDGSKRSAHGNAYFTGLGAAKRVVFFDTLLSKLSVSEVEAVLAHELGHFKHKHVMQRMVLIFAASLAGFAFLGWLSREGWFYTALGVQPNLGAPNDALALLLFMLVVPVFSYFVSPVFAQWSRRHEFQADAYACTHASGSALAAALLKMHADNASTLTPDPLYARFYYSHPPAVERLAALNLRDVVASS